MEEECMEKEEPKNRFKPVDISKYMQEHKDDCLYDVFCDISEYEEEIDEEEEFELNKNIKSKIKEAHNYWRNGNDFDDDIVEYEYEYESDEQSKEEHNIIPKAIIKENDSKNENTSINSYGYCIKFGAFTYMKNFKPYLLENKCTNLIIHSGNVGEIKFMFPVYFNSFQFSKTYSLQPYNFYLFENDEKKRNISNLCPVVVKMENIWPNKNIHIWKQLRTKQILDLEASNEFERKLLLYSKRKNINHVYYNQFNGIWKVQVDYLSSFPINLNDVESIKL